VPVPSQGKLGGLWKKGDSVKKGMMMEVGALIVQMGVPSRQIVSASAYYISLHHKIQKKASNNGGS